MKRLNNLIRQAQAQLLVSELPLSRLPSFNCRHAACCAALHAAQSNDAA